MTRKRLPPEEIHVIPLENGGISVVCEHCQYVLGAGGCICCDENTVTLADLLEAAETSHVCE